MGLFKIFIGGLFKKVFRKADHVQVISNYLVGLGESMGVKAPMEVVRMGGHKKTKTKNEKLKIDEKIIITTSRLVYKNGVDSLISAVAELKNMAPEVNFKVQILGAGPEEKKLKELAKELGVENVVHFLGHIEPENVYEYLTKADIFVRASRTEGLGSSFLEAMGAGLPIIGTPVGGIVDFLKRWRKRGLFCEIDNPERLGGKNKKVDE